LKTRKYQLMLRAYLRGHLQLRRPVDLRSKIRERLLLQAIDAEEMADASRISALISASVIGAADLDAMGRKQLYKQLQSNLESADLLRRLDYGGMAALQAEISGSTITRVYDMLAREGLVGEVEQPGTSGEEATAED
jgi:hypothetical protein